MSPLTASDSTRIVRAALNQFSRVIKRDGSEVEFQPKAITQAIAKAGLASGEFGEEVAAKLTRKVLAVLHGSHDDEQIEVETIQDVVEEVLLNSPYRATGKAFIIYRDQHARLRELTTQAQADLLDSYLSLADWQVSENANMAYSLQGLNNYVASEVTRTYWLNRIYPEEVRKAHVEGDFHIHDLNALSVYCVGWDLADLLTQGFTGAPGKSESAPARHFRSALGQIVNFFYTLQGEAAGAQAFASLDTYLAPFIRSDNLSYRDVKQALQEFVFNLNVPTRVGFQTPFTNITLDLKVPNNIAEEPVILGGDRIDGTRYADYQDEMNMFNKAFLEVMVEGDAKGRVFTFPIPTYNITDDFDFDDPDLETLWEVTARYGIPYFANFMNSELSPDDARSMCCRLRLDTRQLDRRGGGLFGANPLTGSIGVVTMNMPRIGHVCASEDEYFLRLGTLMDMARDSLEIKRKALERLTDQRLYPYSGFYLREIKERRGCWWYNHFSTIGLVGLNESIVNFMGVGLDDARGREFGLKVLDYMRDRLSDFQEQTGHFYNLEATPAEGTSYRLARLDAEHHPGIRFADDGGSNNKPFYSNSSQLPVNHTDDIFGLLDHQDEFQCKYTGGTVQHVFVGEAIDDAETVKNFVRTVCTNYHLPYVSVTPTFSVCPEHGYQAGEQPECPHCGSETEVYSRVVGYLRPTRQWNEGKRAEFTIRSSFDLTPANGGCCG